MENNVIRRDFLKITPISVAIIFMMSFAPWSSALEVTKEGGIIPIIMAVDSQCFIEGHDRVPDSVVQQRVQGMVDASIAELTGIINNMPLAYECMFPWGGITDSTKILIKYNPSTPETTRNPMVNALKKGLTYMLDYTFPAANITLAGNEGTANSTDTIVIDSAGANLKYVIKDIYVNTDYIIYCPSAWGTDVGCGVDMSLKLMMDAVEGTGGATLEDMYPYFTDITSPALSILNYHPVFNGDYGKTCFYMMDLITYSGDGTDVLPGYRIYTTTNITVSDWKGIKFLRDSAEALSLEYEQQALKVCSLACAPYVDLGVVNEGQMYEIAIGPPWNIPVPTIRLTYPNGGETFDIGSSVNITWKSDSGADIGEIEILYSTYGGSNWITVVDSTSNDGIHPWTVPDVNSSNCKIKISDASDGDPFDESKKVFTIEPDPAITVISPNGNETWFAGSPHDIIWSTNGTVGNVRIEYSIDGGSNWTDVVVVTSNDGTHTWLIPADVISSNCMIHICEASDDDPFDKSDNVFEIELPVHISDNPVGHQKYYEKRFVVEPNPVLKHQEVSFRFTPAQAVTGGTLRICDPVGNVIHEIEVPDCKADEQHTFGSWDLKNMERRIVESGSYLALLIINGTDGKVDVMKTLIGIKDTE